MVLRNLPCLLLLTSWYWQVFSLCDDFPFCIWILVPKQYLTKDDESGWTSLLGSFIASLFTMELLKVRGETSGQSISESGSTVAEGV